MSIAIQCPQCQANFGLDNDTQSEPASCPRCHYLFRPDAERAHADGIQASAKPAVVRGQRLAEEIEPGPSMPRPTARPAFPWGPIAIVTIGLMFILLATSVGLNVWYMTGNDKRFRRIDEVLRAEVIAAEQMKRAEVARAQAIQEEQEARRQLEVVREEAAKARQKLDALIEQQDPAANREWGSLEGRVVWKGELPKIENLEEQMRRHVDAEHILKGPKELRFDPTWRIDAKTKGVANVFVFLKRPKDGVLPIHADDKVRKERVVMDAPFCVYEPHVAAIQPEWFDGKNRGDTGQRFVTKNSSPVSQNARIMGDPRFNPGINFVHQTKTEQVHTLNPQAVPLQIRCDIHVWMNGYVGVFDHPYFAITKADGTFTIPRVPAGMEVQVMAWHEVQGWLLTKVGRTMTLKQGKNTLDFEMSAK